MTPENPYRWDSRHPGHVVVRSTFHELITRLQRGQTLLLHAGRGMGKSVLLCHLEHRLRDSGARVVRVEGPSGPQLSVEVLAGLELRAGPSFTDTLAELLANGAQVILLIDEIDAWVRLDQRSSTQATLEQLAKLSREGYPGQLGVLVAGGVGNTLLAHSPWGSTFASRVDRTVYLSPFGATELEELSAPLEQHRRLPQGWLDELMLASGGIPLLACQALQAAWDDPTLWPLDHLARWITNQGGYSKAVQGSITVDEVEGPWRLLLAINAASGGELSASTANDLVGANISAVEALRVLVSAGLVHPDYDIDSDPWLVRPNPSVMHLGFPQRPRMSDMDGFLADLRHACAELRRHAADLSHDRGARRTLVPEAALCAMLAMFLRARGWSVARESQQSLGRTDLRIERAGVSGHFVVEVKIWGRNDYASVTDQLCGYVLPTTLDEGPTLGLFAVVVSESSVAPVSFESAIARVGHRKSDGEWVMAETIRGVAVPIHHFLVDGLRGRG
jgi:hypothetical protein